MNRPERLGAGREFRAVRDCLRLWYAPGSEAMIDTALDFERVLNLAAWHGVLPLVLETLRRRCWSMVPLAVQARFASYARANAGRSAFLTGALVELLSASEDAGIKVVPFKGPALALAAYGRLGLRDYCDLDLLIAPEDLPRMTALLAALGYQAQEQIPPAQLPRFVRSDCSLGFRRAATLVEVHWGFVPRYFDFDLTLADLRGRLTSRMLMGRSIWSFRPEDHLLVVSVHGAKHLWSSLKWICDLAACLAAWPGLDARAAVCEAKRLHAERTLLVGVELARRVTGVTVPALLDERIHADPLTGRFAGSVMRRLEQGRQPEVWDLVSFFVGRHDGLAARVRQAALLATSPTALDWERPLPFPLLVALRTRSNAFRADLVSRS